MLLLPFTVLGSKHSGSWPFPGNCRRQKRVKHRATEERGGEDFAGDKNFFIHRNWLTSLISFLEKSLSLKIDVIKLKENLKSSIGTYSI